GNNVDYCHMAARDAITITQSRPRRLSIMKSHKVRMVLFLAVLISVVFCGVVHAETVTLQFLFADYPTQPWTPATKQLVQEFNETHPQIKVELISGTSGYGNLT